MVTDRGGDGGYIQIEGVTFGYDAANPLFSNVHFGVDLDSRIGIVGPNGAGKSTLLNLILDKLRPLRGEVRRNANLRIAHFTQHAAEQFDYRLNSVDNMIKLFPGVQEQVRWGGEGGVLDRRYLLVLTHGRSRMYDHRPFGILTMPGRSMSGFHRPGRYCVHRRAKRREVSGESDEG